VGTLRAIPGLNVFRPADGLETAMAWAYALQDRTHPSCLVLTRQGLPALERGDKFEPRTVWKGGYILDDGDGVPDLVLVASGSEVSTAVEAAKILRKNGTAVRVVSVPSLELFEAQDATYQRSVVPDSARICAIEAGRSREWGALVGRDGLVIGVDRFGESAPGERIAEEFGFTGPAVAAHIEEWLGK